MLFIKTKFSARFFCKISDPNWTRLEPTLNTFTPQANQNKFDTNENLDQNQMDQLHPSNTPKILHIKY